MRAFIDFEASSLSDDSYPIEVGWVFEDGSGEDHLIRPAPGWTDWDAGAEATHGISRDVLEAQGEDHAAVARRLLEALSPAEAVYCSAPSWDGKWLSVLLRAAGLPRHALRLKDTDEAYALVVRAVLGEGASDEAVGDIRVRARLATSVGPPRHRALADAKGELRLWREVARLAAEA